MEKIMKMSGTTGWGKTSGPYILQSAKKTRCTLTVESNNFSFNCHKIRKTNQKSNQLKNKGKRKCKVPKLPETSDNHSKELCAVSSSIYF
jgi:hypothetical protein